MRTSIKSGKWAITVCLVLSMASVHAQDAPQQTRNQRIQEHQERIRKILEESNKRREQAQQELQNKQGAAAPAAPGSPVAPGQPAPPPGNAPGAINRPPPTGAQPGQALPTGPIQSVRMTPPITAPSPTPAAAPQTARSESRTILLFHPLDSIVKVGDHFKTDLVAETKEGEIDEVSVFLRYPRHVLSPLALDHAGIDPFVKDTIDYEFNPDEGTIFLRTKLEKPTRFAQSKLISIIWEALEPSDGATISYEFGKPPHTTALLLKGSNLMGTLPGAEDGVIRTTVQVVGPKEKPTITKLEGNDLMIGAKPPTVHDDRPDEHISIELRSPRRTVRAGESFDVPVYISNSGEKRMDRIRLYLQFDPDLLEVEDYDAGNVVTRGINIHDAEAREAFPFDFYRYNSADNTKGIIVYEVSASNSHVRGTGKLATIRMKAKKEASGAELVLVRNADGIVPTTGVSFLGQSLLQASDETAKAYALGGISVDISGTQVVDKIEETADNYNPFVSNLARRMRKQQQ